MTCSPADEVVEDLPRGRAYLSDQLRREALSIPLNIAEGAGEYAFEEKARFYRMAKRSATECAGILDVCQRLRRIDERETSKRSRTTYSCRSYVDQDGS